MKKRRSAEQIAGLLRQADVYLGQVMRLVNYAKAKGLKPEYWHQNPTHEERRKFLADNFVEAFTIP